MDLNTWPDAIKIEDIQRTHAEYDEKDPDLGLGKLQIHEDLYEGGSKFRKRANSYLDMRTIEDGGGADINLKSEGNVTSSRGNASLRKKRLRASRYVPVAAGKLEILNAATLQSPPRITAIEDLASGDQSENDIAELFSESPKAVGYWGRLNDDADGSGANLTEIAQDLVRALMMHGRAYLAVEFPVDTGAQTLGQQKDAGVLDARLKAVSPVSVDDWKYSVTGKLEYLRTHTAVEIRDYPWSEPRGMRHEWTYYTPEEVVKYAAEFLEKAPSPQAARRVADPAQHSLKSIPIIPVRIPKSLWLMERLREPVLKHYNRDSSLVWSLNQMGFSLLTLIGTDAEQEVSAVIDPDVEALKMKTGQAQFLSPNVAIFEALSGDLEKQEKAMDDAIQVAALSVATRDTQGRQSGVAKFREFGSLANLLSSYGMALRNAFEAAIAMIKTARGEDKIVKLDGLDRFDIQSLDLKTKQAKDVLPLSTSPTFDRVLTAELLLAHAHDFPEQVRAIIAREALTAPPKEPEAEGPSGPGEAEDPEDAEPLRTSKAKVVENTYKERAV